MREFNNKFFRKEKKGMYERFLAAMKNRLFGVSNPKKSLKGDSL